MRKSIRFALAILSAAALVSPAGAQILPFLSKRDAPPPAPLPANLEADLRAHAGTDTVYFSQDGYTLGGAALATLTAQAQWLMANPTIRVRLEGHGDERDTRDYALAIGERRASAVRDFLVLHGVAPDRISVTTWGKERPGWARVGTSVVGVGPRVVTVPLPPPPLPVGMPPPPPPPRR